MRSIKIKRVLSFLLIAALAVTMFPFAAAAADGETISADSSWPPQNGTGVEGDPYLIEDEGDLLAFASKIGTEDWAGVHVKLTTDVDLNPGWSASESVPDVLWSLGKTGQDAPCFNGVFDGGGHTISGIYLNCSTGYVGIFGGFLDGGKTITVKNLSIVNSYVYGDGDFVGALLGITSSNATAKSAAFSNVYVDADVCSTGVYAGGMVGRIQAYIEATFENCVFAGKVCTTVTGTEANVGGFIGRMEPSTTSRVLFDTCAFYGSVRATTATDYIGGFVGVIINAFEENDIVFNNCICAGKIDGPAKAKNSGNFGKLSNPNAVLVMNECLFVRKFYIADIVQDGGVWNKPFNDGGATVSTSTTFGELYDETKLSGLSALTLPHVDLTAWKASPENDFPLPKTVYYMVYDVASDTELTETPVTKLVGYQLSELNEANEFSVRLVAVLTEEDLNSYSKVGFKVQIGEVAYTHPCTKVYSELMGKDTNDSTITYTAEALGGSYIFALNINDLPQTLGEVTITVTTFHIEMGDTEQTPKDDFTSVLTIDASEIQ